MRGISPRDSQLPLHHVVWQTGEPIHLAAGAVTANGTAMPQVRSSERWAALGGPSHQAQQLRLIIVEALRSVLQGMDPSADQLGEFRDEIQSAVLVAANHRLSSHGVVLLDLSIENLELA